MEMTRTIVVDDARMTETLLDIFDALCYDVAVAGDGYLAIDMIKTGTMMLPLCHYANQ